MIWLKKIKTCFVGNNLKPLYLQQFFCGWLPEMDLKAGARLPGPVKELK
jgi:hypothetical protein